MSQQREKYINKLPNNIKQNMEKIIKKIKEWDLENLDIKLLIWTKNIYRCRYWSFRILFKNEEWVLIIERIKWRWDVYKF